MLQRGQSVLLCPRLSCNQLSLCIEVSCIYLAFLLFGLELADGLMQDDLFGILLSHLAGLIDESLACHHS